MMKNNKYVQGFTLIELLIVLAIIGLLAILTIPQLIGAQKRAEDVAALSCAHAIVRAVNIYEIDNPFTKNIPAVSFFYGDKAKSDEYSTGECTKMAKKLVIQGDGVTDGNYKFKVWSKKGTKSFLITRGLLTESKL